MIDTPKSEGKTFPNNADSGTFCKWYPSNRRTTGLMVRAFDVKLLRLVGSVAQEKRSRGGDCAEQAMAFVGETGREVHRVGVAGSARAEHHGPERGAHNRRARLILELAAGGCQAGVNKWVKGSLEAKGLQVAPDVCLTAW